MEGRNAVVNLFYGVKAKLLQLVVKRLGANRGLHDPVKILFVHGDSAVHKVAKRVCKVGVKTLDDRFVGCRAVVSERHFAEQIVTHRVNTYKLNKLVGINNVSAALAHFVLAEKQPRMTEHLLGKRLTQSHEHNRPVDRMEAYNILAYDVRVRRPVFFVFFAASVGVVAQRGDIV